MARPGLSLDRKFLRLARVLDDVQPGFGDILARGALELLWDSAYEATDDYLGDSDDVEALAHWRGKHGTLTHALAIAGGDGKAGFIEEGGSAEWPDGKPGTYRVHDLWENAPDFAHKRLARELAREQKGTTIRELRSAAGKKGAASTNAKRRATVQPMDGKRPPLAGQTAADVRQVACTLAPTLAPAPTLQEAAAACDRSLGSGSEVAPASPPPDASGSEPVSPAAGPSEPGTPPARPEAAARANAAASPPSDDDLLRRPIGEVVDEAGVREAPPPSRVERFRHLLAERLARTAPHPVGGGRAVLEQVDAALAVIPLDEAVELCAERVLEAVRAGRRQPGTLAYFAQVLADEALRRQHAPAAREPGQLPSSGDPDFDDPSAYPSTEAFFRRNGTPMRVEGPAVRRVEP